MFNNKAKEKTVVMANGNVGFQDKDDFALFMLMNDFKIKNSMYVSDMDKLKKLETLIDKLPEKEVVAMAWYLGKFMGNRLSPTLAITRVALNRETQLRQEIKFALKEVFTRPDFIANSFGYANYCGTTMKKVPTWFKSGLKYSLENMSDITLKKRKMTNKEIKLSDLIKVLRPNPMKAKIKDKNLYKEIIEGKAQLEVSVEENKTESITATLTNTTISKEKKKEIIENSLTNMAINEIIRNISNIEFNEENKSAVLSKLKSVMSREDSLRFINPFDLIIESNTVDSRWLIEFDELLVDFVKRNIGELDSVDILFDISGSMDWGDGDAQGGYKKALKFISLLRPAMTNSRIVWFSINYMTDEGSDNIFDKITRPNDFYAKMSIFLKSTKRRSGWWGGTSINSTVREVITKDNPCKNVLIVTDEFDYSNTRRTQEIRESIKDRNVILYNVDYSTTSAFSITSGILRITGFDGKVLQMIQLIGNFEGFKKSIVKRFEQEFESR